jgi:hypothetical protein
MQKNDIYTVLGLFLRRMKRLSEAYYVAINQSQNRLKSDYEIGQLENGIISTSSGFYRLARDTSNGRINIYYSRAQKYLQPAVAGHGFLDTEKDADGNVIPHAFRYHVGSLSKNAIKEDIRGAISTHYIGIANMSAFRMRLHGGSTTNLNADKRACSTEDIDQESHFYDSVSFGNNDFSLSVHETKDQKWRLQINACIDDANDNGKVVDTEFLRTDNEAVNEFFTSGRRTRDFSKRENALTYMFLMGNQRTQRSWDGRNPNPMRENIFSSSTTATYRYIIGEAKSKENIEEGEFDTGVTVASAAYIGWRVLGFTSIARLAAQAVFSGYVMRKGLALYKMVKVEAHWNAPWGKGIASIDPKDGPYRLNTKNNANRTVNPKPNEESSERLQILDGSNSDNGIDITHDTRKQDHHEKLWKEKWVMSFAAKAFGGFVSMIDENTATDFSYNGLIRLSHRDPKTGELITYAKYVDALAINDKIAVPKEIKALLANGKIVRFSQEKNTKIIEQKDATRDEMMKEICPRLFQTCSSALEQHHKMAEGHLRWLFRKEAIAENIDDDRAALEMPEDSVITAKAEGDGSYLREMKKIFGDDWRSINISTDQLSLIRAFMTDAVFPDVTVAINDFLEPIKDGTVAHTLRKLVTAQKAANSPFFQP